jgi:F-type H+-transporting ATPase subunit alpha
VAVPAQIAVLLALTAELFDQIPLEQMTEAEHALREAAADIPADVRERLVSAEKLSDEDRKAIVEISRKSLVPFQPKPAAKPDAKADPHAEGKTEAKPDAKPKSEAKSQAEPKPKNDGKPKHVAKAEPQPEAKVEPTPGPKKP